MMKVIFAFLGFRPFVKITEINKLQILCGGKLNVSTLFRVKYSRKQIVNI